MILSYRVIVDGPRAICQGQTGIDKFLSHCYHKGNTREEKSAI